MYLKYKYYGNKAHLMVHQWTVFQLIMMMRHLSVESKGLVKSLEEPVANTEAAVGPRLAILSD